MNKTIECLACKKPVLVNADAVPGGAQAVLCGTCQEKGYSTALSQGRLVAVPPKRNGSTA